MGKVWEKKAVANLRQSGGFLKEMSTITKRLD
jgi:hypothetical protein